MIEHEKLYTLFSQKHIKYGFELSENKHMTNIWSLSAPEI